MKKNFKLPILGYDGNPIMEKDGNVASICAALGRSLFTSSMSSKVQLTEQEMLSAYRLFMQMREHPDAVEMTTEEATLIKKIAAQSLVAGAYGQVYSIIENEE